MAIKSLAMIYASENEIALLKTSLFTPFPFTQTLKPIYQLIPHSLKNSLNFSHISKHAEVTLT